MTCFIPIIYLLQENIYKKYIKKVSHKNIYSFSEIFWFAEFSKRLPETIFKFISCKKPSQ